jgi:adenylate cyclase
MGCHGTGDWVGLPEAIAMDGSSVSPGPLGVGSRGMNESTLRELSARAGVEPGFVSRLAELGFLGADAAPTPGAARIVRMVRSLEQAGITVDEMARALANGTLSFSYLELPVFDRFSDLSPLTFKELSAGSGVPVELLTVIREAIGFAQPGPDDFVREDELLVVPAVREHFARGLRPAVIERWLRVYGESARRMAETEADWWRTEIEQPLIAAGLGEGVVLNTAADWGARQAPLVDQAVLAMYHAQEQHAWLDNIVENVEHALDRAGLRARPDRPPAICFLDLTGYTRLTEERGDAAAADHAARLAHLVQRTSQQHGGRAVKWLGDGVMFVFREPGSAALAALEMVEGVAHAGLPPAHVGLHAGPVVFQAGDYFGRTVNIASRISDYARPGEVLLTQETVDLSRSPEVSFADVGNVDLKGIAEPVHLHSAHRATAT